MEARPWIYIWYNLDTGMRGMAGVLDGNIPEDCLIPPITFIKDSIRAKWIRAPKFGMVVIPDGFEHAFGVITREFYERGRLK